MWITSCRVLKWSKQFANFYHAYGQTGRRTNRAQIKVNQQSLSEARGTKMKRKNMRKKLLKFKKFRDNFLNFIFMHILLSWRFGENFIIRQDPKNKQWAVWPLIGSVLSGFPPNIWKKHFDFRNLDANFHDHFKWTAMLSKWYLLFVLSLLVWHSEHQTDNQTHLNVSYLQQDWNTQHWQLYLKQITGLSIFQNMKIRIKILQFQLCQCDFPEDPYLDKPTKTWLFSPNPLSKDAYFYHF